MSDTQQLNKNIGKVGRFPSRWYIVVWDGEGVNDALVWDTDFEGILCSGGPGDRVALFATRKEARQCIDATITHAEWCIAQGTPMFSDFWQGTSSFSIRICTLRLGHGKA